MKRIVLYLWLVACILPGCATQVVDGWVDRADRGLLDAAENTRTLVGRLRESAESDRKVGMSLYLDGLRRAHAAKDLDAEQFDKYETKLSAFLDAADQRRADLDAAEARALGNIEEIRKCLGGIQQASRAFGSTEDVNRRLDRIEGLVKTALSRSTK